MEDDGFVLIDGKLVKPEDVTRAAAKNFRKCDGADHRTVIRRYSACFPYPDLTTPSFTQFKLLLKEKCLASMKQ